MNKLIRSGVILGALCLTLSASAAKQLYDQKDRKAIDAWVATYYKPLSLQGKKIVLSAGQANLEMLNACKEALHSDGGMQLLTQEAFLRLLKLWTHSGEMIKEQSALEVIDVVRALNALNQLRLDWLKKVVEEYEKEQPSFFERIVIRFTQKGKFKLYRDLNTLVKWSKEIVDQFLFFEQELIRSF